MRIILDRAALDGRDEILALLDRIVDRIADEVHGVEVPAANLLKESQWYRQARWTRRKILMKAVAIPPRRGADQHGPHLKSLEVTDLGSARLAEKVAHAPLVILVEDREADGELLEIVVEELGQTALSSLWERSREVTPRALETVSAGGIGSMPQRIERAASDASQEGRPLRLFVVCDRDARWPNDDHGKNRIEAVRESCEKHGVPWHVWQKRSAENYIPDEVFEAVRDGPRNSRNRHRFDALLRRSTRQRDFFPVKNGLKEKERVAAIAAGLYDAGEESDLRLLEKSLFPKRPRPLKLLHEERRGSFTADGLRRRDGTRELDALLSALAREL